MKKTNNKKTHMKNKFVNHLTKHGKKETCEKIILKSFKKIQKKQRKPHKKVIKLAIMNSAPIFRIIKLKKKIRKKKQVKEIPKFVNNMHERIAWSLKILTQTTRKSKVKENFSTKLTDELLLNAKNKSESVSLKTELHKQALTKKHLFLYFRW